MSEPAAARQPMFLVPWPVLVLIGTLATCYAAFALAPADLQEQLLRNYAFIPAEYGPKGDLHGLRAALPFVSHMFLHGSVSHLLINSVWLLAFGTPVARRFGAGLFLPFFALCGIAGAAAQLAADWGSPIAMIGASGAISGLMGAASRMMQPGESPFAVPRGRPVPLLPLFSRQVVTWSAVWTAVNIVAGLTGMGAGQETHLIAWQAHLGGYFAGLVLVGPFAGLAGSNGDGPTPDMA